MEELASPVEFSRWTFRVDLVLANLSVSPMIFDVFRSLPLLFDKFLIYV
jgi:hypothetical protein